MSSSLNEYPITEEEYSEADPIEKEFGIKRGMADDEVEAKAREYFKNQTGSEDVSDYVDGFMKNWHMMDESISHNITNLHNLFLGEELLDTETNNLFDGLNEAESQQSTSIQHKNWLEQNIINGFNNYRDRGNKYLTAGTNSQGSSIKYKVLDIERTENGLVLKVRRKDNGDIKEFNLSSNRNFNPNDWGVVKAAKTYTDQPSYSKFSKRLANNIKEYQTNFGKYSEDNEVLKVSPNGPDGRKVTPERYEELGRATAANRVKGESRGVLVDGESFVNAAAALDYILQNEVSDSRFKANRKTFEKLGALFYKACETRGVFRGHVVSYMTANDCFKAAELLRRKGESLTESRNRDEIDKIYNYLSNEGLSWFNVYPGKNGTVVVSIE